MGFMLNLQFYTIFSLSGLHLYWKLICSDERSQWENDTTSNKNWGVKQYHRNVQKAQNFVKGEEWE